MPKKKMLVAGASGLVGFAAVKHFAQLADWDVVGVSRRIPAGSRRRHAHRRGSARQGALR